MPTLSVSTEEIQSNGHRRAHHIQLDGVISTPTIEAFRKTLSEFMDSGLDMVLDLDGVNYINSTGLGEILRADEHLEMHGCHLLLIHLCPEVKRLVDILGLDSILHVTDNLEVGLAALDQGLEHVVGEPLPEKPKRSSKRLAPPAQLITPRLPDARIAIGLPEESYFSRFIQRATSDKVESARIATNADQFQELLNNGPIDVAIVDSELPDYKEICRLLKTTAKDKLISIISIYSENMDQQAAAADFRIKEDDQLVEPFEARELVALIEREFIRCHEQGVLIHQDIDLAFRGDDESVAQATEMLEVMLNNAQMQMAARDAYLYAIREAIDNARRHGNGGDAKKQIEILYCLDREKITTHIKDDGPGFDAAFFLQRSQKLTPVEAARERHKDGRHGGLGINLMMRCCDEVEYLKPGNVIKLTKYL